MNPIFSIFILSSFAFLNTLCKSMCNLLSFASFQAPMTPSSYQYPMYNFFDQNYEELTVSLWWEPDSNALSNDAMIEILRITQPGLTANQQSLARARIIAMFYRYSFQLAYIFSSFSSNPNMNILTSESANYMVTAGNKYFYFASYNNKTMKVLKVFYAIEDGTVDFGKSFFMTEPFNNETKLIIGGIGVFNTSAGKIYDVKLLNYYTENWYNLLYVNGSNFDLNNFNGLNMYDTQNKFEAKHYNNGLMGPPTKSNGMIVFSQTDEIIFDSWPNANPDVITLELEISISQTQDCINPLIWKRANTSLIYAVYFDVSQKKFGVHIPPNSYSLTDANLSDFDKVVTLTLVIANFRGYGSEIIINNTGKFKFDESVQIQNNDSFSIGDSICSFNGMLRTVKFYQGSEESVENIDCGPYNPGQNNTSPNNSANFSNFTNSTNFTNSSSSTNSLNSSNASNSTNSLNSTNSSNASNASNSSNTSNGNTNNTTNHTQNTTVPFCDLSFFYDEVLEKCERCIQNCLNCTSYQNCFRCDPSTTLTNGFCVNDIPKTNTTKDQNPSKSISPTQETVNKVVDTLVKGIAAAAVPALALGADPSLLWGLANLMQMFYYLLFFNVDYPENLASFLRIFSIGRLSFFPNPMENFIHVEKETLFSPKNFFDNGFSGLFLQTAGNFFIMNVVMICSYGICKILLLLLFKKQSKFRKLIKYFIKELEWSGILRTILTTFFELSIAAFLQVLVMRFDGPMVTGSSLLGLISLFINFGFLIKCYLILEKFRFKKKYQDKIRPLIEDYDLSHPTKRKFMFFNLCRKFLIAFGLVVCYYIPVIQTLIPSMMSFLYLSMLFLYRPHNRLIMNLMEIIFESCYFGIHSLILILAYHETRATFFDINEKEKIGLSIMILIAIPLLANLLTILYEQFRAIKSALRFIADLFRKNSVEKTRKTNTSNLNIKIIQRGIKRKENVKSPYKDQNSSV